MPVFELAIRCTHESFSCSRSSSSSLAMSIYRLVDARNHTRSPRAGRFGVSVCELVLGADVKSINVRGCELSGGDALREQNV